jgi:spermidine synthase
MGKSTEHTPSILKNKLFLYLTEFFAGMSVMAVELGASRLLAPYFSSSQIVWTIIIGTIMIAMALGNIYGGRSADKHPDPGRLYARILIAAVWIAAIPVLGKYVILGVSALLIFSVNSNFLIIAAFAACMVIFVFPLFLLGTVTPSLAKYSVGNLEESGKVVGTLGAFNTIGSIIGTFVPTFVTIPSVGTSVTFLIFAGILLVLGILYFISAGRSARNVSHHKEATDQKAVFVRESGGKGKMIVSVLCYLCCCALGYSDSFAFWESNLAYEGESVYNYLQVKESGRSVILSTNVLFGVQSIYMKNQGLTGMYYDYAMAAPLMLKDREPEDCEVLILGMGTGTYATQCRKYFGDMAMEGVEIDDKITKLARDYFYLPEDVPVTTYDGRAFLNAVNQKYDVIMVDAYQDITIPFQMSSVEFFTLVKEHLKEGGVMVVNMNMRGTGEGNINQYLADTISSVFDEVYTVEVKGSTNRELFASCGTGMIANLETNRRKVVDQELFNMMERVASLLVRYEPGTYLLTDDKAPVELLGIQVIDEIIRAEVAYYKNIYETQGLKGLLEAF